jgi:cytochrome c-type biogenesis protein CcmE
MQSNQYTTQPGETVGYPADAAEERSGWRSHRTRLVILAGVIALAVTYMVYAAFPGNTLYFVTVSEFVDDPKLHDGQTLRVAGALASDTFRRDDGSTLSHFSLGDKQPDVPGIPVGSPQLEATYVGVLPDLFFNPHSEIILEGHYDAQSQVFATDNILVKCPSKYQSIQAENPDTVPGMVSTDTGY